MALYTTLHLHNVPKGHEAEFAQWFDGSHRAAVTLLPGVTGLDRYEVTPEQVMRDIPQPWRYMSVYDFDYPDPVIGIPALGPLIGAARQAGLFADDETERLHSFRLYGDW